MSTVGQSPSYDTASVLFMDIVSYSLRSIDDQTEVLTILEKIVRESAEFQRASTKEEVLSLPTSDGMPLVFLRDPVSSAKCALEVAASLQSKSPTSARSPWKWPVGAGIPQPERKLRYHVAVQKCRDGRDGPAHLDPGQEIQIPPGGDFVFDKQKGREKLRLVECTAAIRELDALKLKI
jgi:hypothetical protein